MQIKIHRTNFYLGFITFSLPLWLCCDGKFESRFSPFHIILEARTLGRNGNFYDSIPKVISKSFRDACGQQFEMLLWSCFFLLKFHFLAVLFKRKNHMSGKHLIPSNLKAQVGRKQIALEDERRVRQARQDIHTHNKWFRMINFLCSFHMLPKFPTCFYE